MRRCKCCGPRDVHVLWLQRGVQIGVRRIDRDLAVDSRTRVRTYEARGILDKHLAGRQINFNTATVAVFRSSKNSAALKYRLAGENRNVAALSVRAGGRFDRAVYKSDPAAGTIYGYGGSNG